MRWEDLRRQTIYNTAGLPWKTANTITDVDTLEIQLAEFEKQGYALDFEENEIGVNGIARAIRDGLGEIAAAISVSGPANRLTKGVMERIAPEVVAAAGSITKAIGGDD